MCSCMCLFVPFGRKKPWRERKIINKIKDLEKDKTKPKENKQEKIKIKSKTWRERKQKKEDKQQQQQQNRKKKEKKTPANSLPSLRERSESPGALDRCTLQGGWCSKSPACLAGRTSQRECQKLTKAI